MNTKAYNNLGLTREFVSKFYTPPPSPRPKNRGGVQLHRDTKAGGSNETVRSGRNFLKSLIHWAVIILGILHLVMYFNIFGFFVIYLYFVFW
jgi:hypothetical protein